MDDAKLKARRAALKAACARLKYEADEFYAILSDEAKRPIKSTTELTIGEADACLDRLNRGRDKPGQRFPRPYSVPGTKSVADKALAMWLTLQAAGVVRDSSEDALNSFCRRMTGLASVRWLDKAEHNVQNQLLNALRGWAKRVDDERLRADVQAIMDEQRRTGERLAVVVLRLYLSGTIGWWPQFDLAGIERPEA